MTSITTFPPVSGVNTDDYYNKTEVEALIASVSAGDYTAEQITESTAKQFVSATEKAEWTAKETVVGAQTKATAAGQDAKVYAGLTFIKKTQKGVAEGVATLDAEGKVPTTQLALKTINGETILGKGNLDLKVNFLDVVDDLVTNNNTKVLAASQGVVLKQFIDNINTIIQADAGSLEELQEIVDFIKANREDLDNLSINNIAGLENALDTKVDKVDGFGLSANDFTDDFLAKLNNIQDDTTNNLPDATLLSRENHTGTQPQSTIDGLPDALSNKVDKVEGKGLSDSNYTQAEKDKLSSLEGSKFVGLFVNESALPTSGGDGDYANVDGGAGNDVYRVIWDSTNSKWVAMQGVSTELTPAQIKQQYESNPDTKVFSNDEKIKLEGIASEATKNRADSLNADKEHTHTWDQVTGKPTSYPTNWDDITGKPTGFPINWDDVSNKPIVQTVGTSTTDFMSQKAVTEAIANISSVSKSSDYTVVAADKGKSIDTSSNVTIPASVFTVGDIIVVTNMSTSNISITPASGVIFRLAGTDSTGTRTLSGYGVATLRMASNNLWFTTGVGLT